MPPRSFAPFPRQCQLFQLIFLPVGMGHESTLNISSKTLFQRLLKPTTEYFPNGEPDIHLC